MGMIQEFKDFAMKGNVVDMAVGVIIGGAFGGIVKSLIDDLIMPVVGSLYKADFTNIYHPLSGQAQGLTLEKAKEGGAVLAYGNFITILINFLIMAFAVFLMVKLMNSMKKKQEAGPPPAPPEDVVLLREIRDALKSR